MTARFICRKDPQGYWRISFRDGQLLAQGSHQDMMRIIRAIHGRTIPKPCKSKNKKEARA